MRSRTFRRSAILGLVFFVPLLAACGGAGAGTSPSSTPTPTPTPTPSPGNPSPAPIPAGNSLSVTPSSIRGQGQPQATVTLANAAGNGGALVLMTSSDTGVAKVPASVTIAAGSRSATFLIDTSTVSASTTVTITASYAGASMSSTLTVTPTTLSLGASFVVRSASRGIGACVMEESTADFDCVLDGSASQGSVAAWIWTYTAGTSTLGHTSKDAGSHPQISTKCTFLNTATGGDGPNGDRYLNMEVTLQVQDRDGVRTDIIRQPVKLYPNHTCGFSY